MICNLSYCDSEDKSDMRKLPRPGSDRTLAQTPAHISYPVPFMLLSPPLNSDTREGSKP